MVALQEEAALGPGGRSGPHGACGTGGAGLGTTAMAVQDLLAGNS